MINVLIADNDVNYAIMLMNRLNSINNNIKVFNIAIDKNSTINIINNNNNIDVVVLALPMNKQDEDNFFRKIMRKYKDINCFIKLTDNQEKYKDNECNFYSMNEPKSNLSKNIIKINRLVEEIMSKKRIKSRNSMIVQELTYLEYDLSLKGTQYLINTIEIISNGEYGEVYNLEKDIYPQITNLYNSTVHNIKNNINRANNSMYIKCEIGKLKNYFGFRIEEKPKTKEIINTVIRKLS